MPSSVEANLPPTNEGYGTKEYWWGTEIYQERYNPLRSLTFSEPPGTTFDWFLSPDYLLPLLDGLTHDLGKVTRILMLGCGNSRLSEVMYDAGYTNIVNIDYSAKVIEQMKIRNSSRPKMEWLEMDILNLGFEDGEFDLVIDKGTMDAMLTSKGDPWCRLTWTDPQNPPEKDIVTCTREVDEALRVLRKQPTSRFVYFTFGQPHFRKRFMANRSNWSLSHKEIGPPEGFAYFMYTLAYTS